MEVPVAAAGEVTKCGIVHLEREFGYLVHFRRTVVKLREMHGKLADATNDVRTLLHAAGNNGDVIRESVLGWQRRAETVQEEAAHLIAEAGAVNSWFKGWCCSRFSIGRKAEKKNAEIQALLDEKSGMGGTVADPKPSQSLPLVSAGDFDAFASRVHTTQEVIQALNEERIHIVGVYGMPGVGKTMLIKALAKQVKEDSLFNEVVVVIVSQFPDLKKVQGDIARSLDLNLREGDTSLIRAARLSERLSQGKKVLIVLDDLWERLELAEIGIPFKNNDNRCKVVFTTRNRAVCHKMETDRDIQVELLSEKDSWTLFCQKAAVEGSGISTRIVEEIVNECGRLPLAIVTLASALRNNKKEAIWKDTLTQLKKSRHKDMEPVFSSLQLSFNFLPNDETKMCFFLCCLFPEDYRISVDVLRNYMWGGNLFEDVDTVGEARDRLLSLLDELTSSNLLLESDDRWIWRYGTYRHGDSYFVMHDVVRDAAIQIASKDDKLGFKVKAGMGLIRWPEVDWTYCKRMSVMGNIIRCDLPSQIKASHLLTLSLRDNENLEEIPSDFFSEMGGLLTLDLSETGISFLPSSISSLVNLRTLLIERCRLKSISPIQELETLEILSFREAYVSKWPEGICKIRKLKLLDFTGSTWDEIIPLKVIGSMHQLEDLLMLPRSLEIKDDSLSELESLTRLTSLELNIQYTGTDTLLLNLEKLTSFNLRVSQNIYSRHPSFKAMEIPFTIREVEYPEFQRISTFQKNRYLFITSGSIPNWVLVLMAKTEYLFLNRCECSVEKLDGKGFTVLKVLEIVSCLGTKFLMDFNAAEMTPKSAFSSLEILTIRDLFGFEAFYRGVIPDEFFSKLRVLEVSYCKRLINLVPTNLLVRLQNLESLTVEGCLYLKEVIQIEEGEENRISRNKSNNIFSNFPSSPIFPNLKDLSLKDCDELEHIFPFRVFHGLSQLTKLSIVRCRKLKIIFGSDSSEGSTSTAKNKLLLPKLRLLILTELPQLSTICLPSLMVDCPSLEKFRVTGCLHLKKLPFDIASVPNLKALEASEGWFDSLEWDDEDTKSLLKKALVFKVSFDSLEWDDEDTKSLLKKALVFKYSSDEEDDEDVYF